MDKETLEKYLKRAEAVTDSVQKKINKGAKDLSTDILALLLLYGKENFRDLPQSVRDKVNAKMANFRETVYGYIKDGENSAINVAKDLNKKLSIEDSTLEYSQDDDGLKRRIATNTHYLGKEILAVAALAIAMGWKKGKAIETFAKNLNKIYRIPNIKIEAPHRGRGYSTSAITQLGKSSRMAVLEAYHGYNGMLWASMGKGYFVTQTTSFAPCSYCVDAMSRRWVENPLPYHVHCRCVCWFVKEK